MKRVVFAIVLSVSVVCAVSAQMVRYPYQSLIKKGEYQEAKANIEKEMKKTPDATGLNYSAYKLYSDKLYKGYDLAKAYTYLARSWESFKALKGTERVMAEKNGLSDRLYRVNIEYVCTAVYEQMTAEGATEEKLDAYLSFYTLAPEKIRVEIAGRRDAIRRDDSQDSDREMCELLKKNPTGNWVEAARRRIYAKAVSGENVELSECAVMLFDGEEREKILGVLHGRYVERNLDKVDSLYEKFKGTGSATLKMHSEYDNEKKRALSESNGTITRKLINVMAPYNMGVVMMAEYADSLTRKTGMTAKEVLTELDKFKESYGGNRWYRNLMNAYRENPDGMARKADRQLFSAVNTKGGKEYSPFIAANDSVLYFVGKGRGDNLGGEDIFVTKRGADGSWGKPERLTSLNTEKGNEAVEAVTVDGEEMILFKNGKLYQAQKHGKTWGKTVLMSAINISSWQADAMVTSDGNAILFAANTKTGREVQPSQNIYVTVRDSAGEWGKPIELGATINSAFNDRAPFMHPDMKTLYFSSEGHGSLGSYDIWMSRRKSDKSWTEWTEPVNLGRSINSAGNECWYKISTDGSRAYFSKTTEDAKEELFSIELPESMRPEPVAIIKGKITNKEGKILDSKIKWEDLETGEVIGSVRTNSTDGSYFIVLPLGKRYGYFVEKEGYYPIANWVDLKNEKRSVTVDRDIEMVSIDEMLNENAAVPLNNLFFDSGKSELLPESRLELDRVVMMINSIKVKIEISGYTDNRGEPDKNQRLSEDRCRSVRDYLISRGCDYYRFTIIGYGQERPRATNDTPEGRQLNRRVELRLVK